MHALTRVCCWLAVLAVLVVFPSCSSQPRSLPPGDDPPASPANSKREYVGLSRRDAAIKAWAAGQSYRIVEVDGARAPAKGPRQSDRLNFTIRDGVVVKVTKG